MKRISTEGKKVNHSDFSYQAKQWDYERNSNPPEWALSHEKLVFVGSSQTPSTTNAGSNKFAFWRCPEGPDHRWYAQINSRCGGQSGCPFCSSNRANTDGRLRTVFSVTVTLEGNNEYMSLEWDPIANNGVLPREVPLKHSVSRSWRCPNSPDHVWATAPGNRNLEDNETECPFCPSDYHDNKRSLSVITSLESSDLRHELDFDTIQPRLPRHVTLGNSRILFTWRCTEGPDHVWTADVGHRSGGYKMARKPTGCPCCSRPTKQTSVTNSLEMTHEYLIPEIDIKKNQYLARDLTAGSTAHGITWTCLEESHDFCLNVASRIKRLTPCPECSQEKATVGYNLTTEHPHLVSQIDPFRNGIGFDPTTVHPNSETMIWWRCPTGPDHVWKQSPYVRGTKGTGCPYCPSKQGSTRFASCTFSLESTKALENLKYTWSEDNDKLTREVPTKSDYRALVYCEKGHERRTAVYNITGDQASGCGACKLQGRSKIEIQIEFELATIFQSINTTIYSKHREIHLIGQKRNLIKIDILIPELNLIVEYDGNPYHKEKENDSRSRFDTDSENADMLRSRYHVMRVRDNLELTNSQWDVLIPKGGGRGPKRITDAILRKILDRREELGGRLTDQKIDKINAYLGEGGPRKRNEAFNAIDDAISNSG